MELWQEIQAAVDYGFQIAANIVGIPHLHYRPITANNPISVTNQLVNQSVLIDRHSSKFKYEVPEVHGKPYRDAILDVIACKNGDYLVSTIDGNISFISNIEPLEYATIVKCNRIASFIRPGAVDATYLGDIQSEEIVNLLNFPCSILQGTKGEASDTGIPTDTRIPWFSILLPVLPSNYIIRHNDFMTDDLGRRYEIASVELSAMGWRLSASEKEV